MPCLRGIELSLLVPPDSALLPEFPHPDASSVRVVSLGEAAKKVEEIDAAPPGSDSPRIQKTTPRASVYVPSMPGTQFWVQYSVHRAPEPPCYLFFKLFINGRNITSCGIKPGTASGVITRALFEPSDKWHLKQNGKLLKISGIESRSFCFSPGPDAIAAADDGGLIEIQVFRAKSRRRSTPQLAPHRDQERYGIVSPSTGLLEHPEDAMYYEWVLHDATEAPFATFCFHYRAWTYLWDLNLVPDSSTSPMHHRILCEGFGRDRRKAVAYENWRDESEAVNMGFDLEYCNENANGIRMTASRATREHHHSQDGVLLNEGPQAREVKNGLVSREGAIFSSSAASSRKSLHSHAPLTAMEPPAVKDGPFADLYRPPELEIIAAPPVRSYSRESLFFSHFRRPLPTVDEVPRLE